MLPQLIMNVTNRLCSRTSVLFVPGNPSTINQNLVPTHETTHCIAYPVSLVKGVTTWAPASPSLNLGKMRCSSLWSKVPFTLTGANSNVSTSFSLVVSAKTKQTNVTGKGKSTGSCCTLSSRNLIRPSFHCNLYTCQTPYNLETPHTPHTKQKVIVGGTKSNSLL